MYGNGNLPHWWDTDLVSMIQGHGTQSKWFGCSHKLETSEQVTKALYEQIHKFYKHNMTKEKADRY